MNRLPLVTAVVLAMVLFQQNIEYSAKLHLITYLTLQCSLIGKSAQNQDILTLFVFFFCMHKTLMASCRNYLVLPCSTIVCHNSLIALNMQTSGILLYLDPDIPPPNSTNFIKFLSVELNLKSLCRTGIILSTFVLPVARTQS